MTPNRGLRNLWVCTVCVIQLVYPAENLHPHEPIALTLLSRFSHISDKFEMFDLVLMDSGSSLEGLRFDLKKHSLYQIFCVSIDTDQGLRTGVLPWFLGGLIPNLLWSTPSLSVKMFKRPCISHIFSIPIFVPFPDRAWVPVFVKLYTYKAIPFWVN